MKEYQSDCRKNYASLIVQSMLFRQSFYSLFKRSGGQRTQCRVLPEMENPPDEANHIGLNCLINKSGFKMLHKNINGLPGRLDFVQTNQI